MEVNLWRRLKDTLAGGMRQRITTAGFVYSAIVIMVGAVAFLSANNLLFLLLAAMLATMLVSGFISRLSLAGLELDFALPDHISARRKVKARVRLHNEKSWMPSYSIHLSGAPKSVFSRPVYFPVVPGGKTVEVAVDVEFARRGVHSESSFIFWSKFPFGFAERQAQVSLRRDALVYPCLDPLPVFEEALHRLQGEIEVQVRGRGHDFYRIRPYEPLESSRHVDWKATAHTGELQVREFARELDPLVELFLDLEIPEAARPWFEKAVECAAYLCWQLAARGGRIRFRTQEADHMLPAEGDIYTILKYLALVEPRAVPAGGPMKEIPFAPGQEDSIQVVITASPRRLAKAGWSPVCLLDIDALGGERAGAGARTGS